MGQAGLDGRDVARGPCLVARQRRNIAGIRDRITLLAGAQPRLSAPIASLGGVFALVGGAITDVATDVVLFGVTPGR